MCVCPILIKDRRYKDVLHGKRLLVPCGHCLECQNRKGNDLYIRAKMEYNHALEVGGCGFMCCLTYSDDLLPRVSIPTPQGELSFMCFNKQDVIDFMKRLRTNLDRYYKKNFSRNAPDFKYLVTSEYGTDPTRTHRPHYHLILIFYEKVSPVLFKQLFTQSTYNKRTKERYFGYILQCDLLVPEKGGIKYSAKYVCKDITYNTQDKYIRSLINYYKDVAIQRFGIKSFAESDDDLFYNRCIRSRKDYKEFVETYIRPLRHKLQFYMVSNDMGSSCVVEKYGKGLVDMPILNLDGFPFALPSIVKSRYERIYGFEEREKLNKSIFLNFFKNVLNDLYNNEIISKDEKQDLCYFATNYIIPRGGELCFVCPDCDIFSPDYSASYSELYDVMRCYDDNDFFQLRDRISSLLLSFNSDERLKFRSTILVKKFEKEKERYEQKKYNKNASF